MHSAEEWSACREVMCGVDRALAVLGDGLGGFSVRERFDCKALFVFLEEMICDPAVSVVGVSSMTFSSWPSRSEWCRKW